MTTTNLDALIAAADLSDADERLMLADAYEEAGLLGDAAILRDQTTLDADALAQIPHRSCQVRQTTGYTDPDEFGRTMSYEREVTVSEDYRDHADGIAWEKQSPSARRWWIEVIEALFSARYRLASASLEVRAYVEEALGHESDYDLESLAARIDGLIDEAQEAAE